MWRTRSIEKLLEACLTFAGYHHPTAGAGAGKVGAALGNAADKLLVEVPSSSSAATPPIASTSAVPPPGFTADQFLKWREVEVVAGAKDVTKQKEVDIAVAKEVTKQFQLRLQLAKGNEKACADCPSTPGACSPKMRIRCGAKRIFGMGGKLDLLFMTELLINKE
ncbi:uncharacterized protein EV422DRAFT_35629 [Fimicolochytrium jonesii]|uniref:uncharacterized protein n=1 Tax=Fimicolochytrium jonesii TaxID=1396493 RepID=UPI0022FDB896|nr:uncharacterized protein EV422DRAFT_35629 [Fimicolochytrium jonesii]KAI8821273.1 hypothetical protein EV422DRAFT_35629 [Fimicolochytrium jonesii]